MQVRETSVRELVGGQRQFRVPIFQRRYGWESKQHKQLWADVVDQYDALGEERPASAGDVSTHFLGSFVVMPIPAPSTAAVPAFQVVDGQQRLTSLLLLLCAIRDVAAETDEEAIGKYNDWYITNPHTAGNEYYKLIPTEDDQRPFFSVVRRDLEGAADGRIREAYEFYAKTIRAGGDGQPFDLERLRKAVTERLSIVDITTGVGDNPFRIFESINATGLSLTQADLLRNYIFMRLPNRGAEVYRSIWRPLEDEIGTSRLEGLARVDLQRRGLDVQKDDIYRQQKERLDKLTDEDDIEREVRDLRRRGSDYLRIVQPQNEPDRATRESLERLQRWGAQTAHPLLMSLYDLRRRDLCTIEDLRAALSYIESFVIRRQLVGVATNTLSRMFIQMLDEVDPSDVAGSVQRALSRERRYWPSDAQLREAVRTRNFYYQGRWNQRFLILRRLEESYDHPETVDFAATKLTIEHILPQTLSEAWRAHLLELGQDPDEVYELRHTLGNLTLTAFNGELSNDPFERKRQIYGDSGLRLNRALAEGSTWGREDILKRADELAEKAIRLWPAPLAEVDLPQLAKGAAEPEVPNEEDGDEADAGRELAERAHRFARTIDPDRDGLHYRDLAESLSEGAEIDPMKVYSSLNRAHDLFTRRGRGIFMWKVAEGTDESTPTISGRALALAAQAYLHHADSANGGVHYQLIADGLVTGGHVLRGPDTGATMYNALNNAPDLFERVTSGVFRATDVAE